MIIYQRMNLTQTFCLIMAIMVLGNCSFRNAEHSRYFRNQGLKPTEAKTAPNIVLPDGFKIEVVGEAPGARQMAYSESGHILYVGTMGEGEEGKVYALQDTNGDYKWDVQYVIAEGLNMPNGVALKGKDLYVAEVNRVLKFYDIDNNLKTPKYVIVRNDFPTETHHGWKYIKFGPDGKLYVPIGAPCNICDRGDPYASIHRMNSDGTGLETFARGIRNTVGFDWDPATNQLWFTDNGRDMLGDDIPADELNVAPVRGMHFGYPYCHEGDLPDPEFGGYPCELFAQPMYKFQAHVAALGVEFYTGSAFPKDYQGGAFIALHGSWNRSKKVGYEVMHFRVQNGKVVGHQLFAHGWLENETVTGRPVDLLTLPDGSLLLSDDKNGYIYRITYNQ